MSPHLLERIYHQVKRVFSKRVALTNEHGTIFPEFSDFSPKKSFPVRQFNRQLRVVPIEGNDQLQGIPVTHEEKFVTMVIAEIGPNDVQTPEIIASLAELIVQQFILQYRPRPDAVDLLLTRLAYKPTTIDQEELSHQLLALGYRLDLPRAALSVELRGFHDHYLQELGASGGEKESLIAAKKRDIDQSLTNFFTKNPDNLVGFIGNDIFLVLKDLSDSDYERFCELLVKHYREITNVLKNIHIQEVTIGVGSLAASPGSLSRSVEEAIQVLSIGKKIVGSNRVHRATALGVLPLVLSGQETQKREYAQGLISKLDDEQLSTTLQAFLEADLNLTKTAENLKIHRNTVIYRLDKILERLGKDPRRFNDAVELHLGLLFGRIFP